jgi:hypothetical protein
VIRNLIGMGMSGGGAADNRGKDAMAFSIR